MASFGCQKAEVFDVLMPALDNYCAGISVTLALTVSTLALTWYVTCYQVDSMDSRTLNGYWTQVQQHYIANQSIVPPHQTHEGNANVRRWGGSEWQKYYFPIDRNWSIHT
jgi:hypothetical protein